MSNYIQFREVMKKYKKTYSQVKYAVETGRLEAEKIGWVWIFDVGKLPSEWPQPPKLLKAKR